MSLILELPNSLVNQVWKTKDEEIINDLLQELGMFMTCLRVFDDKQIQIIRSCKSSLPEFRLPLDLAMRGQLRACHPQVPAAEDNRDPGAQPAAGAGPDHGETEAGHLAHGGFHSNLGVLR